MADGARTVLYEELEEGELSPDEQPEIYIQNDDFGDTVKDNDVDYKAIISPNSNTKLEPKLTQIVLNNQLKPYTITSILSVSVPNRPRLAKNITNDSKEIPCSDSITTEIELDVLDECHQGRRKMLQFSFMNRSSTQSKALHKSPISSATQTTTSAADIKFDELVEKCKEIKRQLALLDEEDVPSPQSADDPDPSKPEQHDNEIDLDDLDVDLLRQDALATLAKSDTQNPPTVSNSDNATLRHEERSKAARCSDEKTHEEQARSKANVNKSCVTAKSTTAQSGRPLSYRHKQDPDALVETGSSHAPATIPLSNSSTTKEYHPTKIDPSREDHKSWPVPLLSIDMSKYASSPIIKDYRSASGAAQVTVKSKSESSNVRTRRKQRSSERQSSNKKLKLSPERTQQNLRSQTENKSVPSHGRTKRYRRNSLSGSSDRGGKMINRGLTKELRVSPPVSNRTSSRNLQSNHNAPSHASHKPSARHKETHGKSWLRGDTKCRSQDGGAAQSIDAQRRSRSSEEGCDPDINKEAIEDILTLGDPAEQIARFLKLVRQQQSEGQLEMVSGAKNKDSSNEIPDNYDPVEMDLDSDLEPNTAINVPPIEPQAIFDLTRLPFVQNIISQQAYLNASSTLQAMYSYLAPSVANPPPPPPDDASLPPLPATTPPPAPPLPSDPHPEMRGAHTQENEDEELLLREVLLRSLIDRHKEKILQQTKSHDASPSTSANQSPRSVSTTKPVVSITQALPAKPKPTKIVSQYRVQPVIINIGGDSSDSDNDHHPSVPSPPVGSTLDEVIKHARATAGAKAKRANTNQPKSRKVKVIDRSLTVSCTRDSTDEPRSQGHAGVQDKVMGQAENDTSLADLVAERDPRGSDLRVTVKKTHALVVAEKREALELERGQYQAVLSELSKCVQRQKAVEAKVTQLTQQLEAARHAASVRKHHSGTVRTKARGMKARLMASTLELEELVRPRQEALPNAAPDKGSNKSAVDASQRYRSPVKKTNSASPSRHTNTLKKQKLLELQRAFESKIEQLRMAQSKTRRMGVSGRTPKTPASIPPTPIPRLDKIEVGSGSEMDNEILRKKRRRSSLLEQNTNRKPSIAPIGAPPTPKQQPTNENKGACEVATTTFKKPAEKQLLNLLKLQEEKMAKVLLNHTVGGVTGGGQARFTCLLRQKVQKPDDPALWVRERVERESRHTRPYTHYTSPLLCFSSYRLCSYYRTKENLSLMSATHSNTLTPHTILCRFSIQGVCNDDSCQWQHESDYRMSDIDLLRDITAYHPAIAAVDEHEKDVTKVETAISKYVDELRSQHHSMTNEELAVLLTGVVKDKSGKARQHVIAKKRLWFPRQRDKTAVTKRKLPTINPAKHSDVLDVPLNRRSNTTELDNILSEADARYFTDDNVSLPDMEAAILDNPHDVYGWIKLAYNKWQDLKLPDQQRLEHGLNILARGLEHNKASALLWQHYLRLYTRHPDSCHDYREMCATALGCVEDYLIWWQYLHSTKSCVDQVIVCKKIIDRLKLGAKNCAAQERGNDEARELKDDAGRVGESRTGKLEEENQRRMSDASRESERVEGNERKDEEQRGNHDAQKDVNASGTHGTTIGADVKICESPRSGGKLGNGDTESDGGMEVSDCGVNGGSEALNGSQASQSVGDTQGSSQNCENVSGAEIGVKRDCDVVGAEPGVVGEMEGIVEGGVVGGMEGEMEEIVEGGMEGIVEGIVEEGIVKGIEGRVKKGIDKVDGIERGVEIGQEGRVERIEGVERKVVRVEGEIEGTVERVEEGLARGRVCERGIVEESECRSFHLVEVLLYLVSLHVHTGKYKTGLQLLGDALSDKQSDLSPLIRPSHRGLLWLSYIYLSDHNHLPDALYNPANQNASRIVSMEPFTLTRNQDKDTSKTSTSAYIALVKRAISDIEACLPATHVSHDQAVSRDWSYVEGYLCELYQILIQVQCVHKFNDARNTYKTAVKLHPYSVDLWLTAVAVETGKQCHDKAVQLLHNALSANPYSAKLTYYTVNYYFQQDGAAVVMEILEKYVRGAYGATADDSTHNTNHLYLKLLSQCLPLQHNATTLECRIPAHVLHTQLPYIWLDYCLLLEVQGAISDAIEAYETAISSLQSAPQLTIVCIEYLRFSRHHPDVTDLPALVTRCLSCLPLNQEVPYSDGVYWDNYRCHNDILASVIDSLPPAARLHASLDYTTKMPANVDLIIRACELALMEGDDQSALILATSATYHHPANITLWKMLVALCIKQGKLHQARKFYLSALQLLPYAFNLWKDYMLYEVTAGSEDMTAWILDQCHTLGINIKGFLMILSR